MKKERRHSRKVTAGGPDESLDPDNDDDILMDGGMITAGGGPYDDYKEDLDDESGEVDTDDTGENYSGNVHEASPSPFLGPNTSSNRTPAPPSRMKSRSSMSQFNLSPQIHGINGNGHGRKGSGEVYNDDAQSPPVLNLNANPRKGTGSITSRYSGRRIRLSTETHDHIHYENEEEKMSRSGSGMPPRPPSPPLSRMWTTKGSIDEHEDENKSAPPPPMPPSRIMGGSYDEPDLLMTGNTRRGDEDLDEENVPPPPVPPVPVISMPDGNEGLDQDGDVVLDIMTPDGQ